MIKSGKFKALVVIHSDTIEVHDTISKSTDFFFVFHTNKNVLPSWATQQNSVQARLDDIALVWMHIGAFKSEKIFVFSDEV